MVLDLSYILGFKKIILYLGEDIMNAGLWDESLWGTKISSFSVKLIQSFILFQPFDQILYQKNKATI